MKISQDLFNARIYITLYICQYANKRVGFVKVLTFSALHCDQRIYCYQGNVHIKCNNFEK